MSSARQNWSNHVCYKARLALILLVKEKFQIKMRGWLMGHSKQQSWAKLWIDQHGYSKNHYLPIIKKWSLIWIRLFIQDAKFCVFGPFVWKLSMYFDYLTLEKGLILNLNIQIQPEMSPFEGKILEWDEIHQTSREMLWCLCRVCLKWSQGLLEIFL